MYFMVLEGQGCRPFPSVLSLSRRMETPSRLINHGLRSCVYLQHVSHNDTRRINTKTICTSLKSAPPFTTLKISCFFGCRQLSHKKKLVCPPPQQKKEKGREMPREFSPNPHGVQDWPPEMNSPLNHSKSHPTSSIIGPSYGGL